MRCYSGLDVRAVQELYGLLGYSLGKLSFEWIEGEAKRMKARPQEAQVRIEEYNKLRRIEKHIPSHSSEGVIYTVRRIRGKWSCTCNGMKFRRGGACIHIKEAQTEMGLNLPRARAI